MAPQFVRIIRFPHGPPTPEHIQENVARKTGLPVALEQSPYQANLDCSLAHPLLKSSCEFRVTADAVELTYLERLSYLDLMALAALIDLGGIYDSKLPAWTQKPWHALSWWQRWLYNK